MIRALHGGKARVRLALTHIRVSVGRPFKALYLKPLFHTTDVERVQNSPYYWHLVERNGVVLKECGLKFAPRSWRRRARIGGFLSRKLGLQASDFKWRGYRTVESDKWALNLQGIVKGLRDPKALPEPGNYVPKGPGPLRPFSDQNPPPQVTRMGGQVVAGDKTGFILADGTPMPSAIEIAWDSMTPAEKRTASRRASKTGTLAI